MILKIDGLKIYEDGSLEGNLTGSDILTKYLIRAGIEYVFGVPGALMLPFLDRIYEDENIDMIQATHEQSAAFMADGYARIRGISACCGTMGPGALNLVTGVASAYMDSVPIIVITSQVYASDIGKGACQEGTGEGRTPNHNKIFESITKYSVRIQTVDQLPLFVEKAIRIAKAGRPGPVHLDIPANIFLESAYVRICPNKNLQLLPDNIVNSSSSIEEMFDVLDEAKFPIILSGNGVRISNSHSYLLELVKTLNIPVATTYMGKGSFPEEHSLALGCIGAYGQEIANKIVFEECDCILALGVSFQEFATFGWRKELSSKKIIQIDIDVSEIGKNYPVAVGINADLRTILPQILKQTRLASFNKRFNFEELVSGLKDKYGYYSYRFVSNNSTLQPEEAIMEISNFVNSNDIVCVDVGEHAYWTQLLIKSNSPNSFIINGGLGSMGHGIVASVGVALAADKGSKVFCICGDGGFLMTGNSVNTAVKYKIPVIWCIINNSCYGANKRLQETMLKKRFIGTELPSVDFASYSTSLGATGYTVENTIELNSAINKACKSNVPVVIDILVDKEAGPSKRKKINQ